MNPRQRQVRFERLKQLDQQKLDRLATIAREAALRVEQTRKRQQHAEEQFERELQLASAQPELATPLQAWERCVRGQLTSLQSDVEQALAAWQTARQEVEQQQNRIRAWDKLLERLALEAKATETALETRQADEAFLQKQVRQRS